MYKISLLVLALFAALIQADNTDENSFEIYDMVPQEDIELEASVVTQVITINDADAVKNGYNAPW